MSIDRISKLAGIRSCGCKPVKRPKYSLVALEIFPLTPSLPVGFTQSFKAIGLFKDGSRKDLTRRVAWSSSNRKVASISNRTKTAGQARGLHRGASKIKASFRGLSAAAPLKVTSATLVAIEVVPQDSTLAVGFRGRFLAIGLFSDGTLRELTDEVLWSSSDPAVASISNRRNRRGVATALSSGITEIRAVRKGVCGSATLKVTQALLASIEVSPSNPTIAAGLNESFTATGVFSDGSLKDLTDQVLWSSSNPAIATVSNELGSEGTATALTQGQSTISAAQNGVSGSTTLEVTTAALLSIEVSPINPELPVGFTESFTAIGLFSDQTTKDLTTQVVWSSSDPGVAPISNAEGSQGLATGLSPGSAQIQAALQGLSGSTTLRVTAATLVSIEVTPANSTLPIGMRQSFTATGIFNNSTTRNLTHFATWSSSNAAIASISNAPISRGVATGLEAGSTTITASLNGISGSTALTTSSAVLTAIEVSADNPLLPVGFTEPFTAVGLFSDHTTQDLTDQAAWSSSNAEIASVSNAAGSQGFATGLSPGTVQIRALFEGITGSASLTVTPAALVSIEVDPATSTLPLGLTEAYAAVGLFSDSTTKTLTSFVTWSSSDFAIASISNASGTKGIATALSQGSVQIQAALKGLSGTAALQTTPALLQSIEVGPVNSSISAGLTQAFTATGIFSDNTVQDITDEVLWISSNTTTASISNASGSAGVAKGLAPGNTTISATMNGIYGSTRLTVTAAVLQTLSITPPDPTAAAGSLIPFTATGSYSDGSTQNLTEAVFWSSSVPTVASISNAMNLQGLARALSQGATQIAADFNGISGSALLTVTPALLAAIEVSPLRSTLPLALTESYRAIGLFSDLSKEDLTDQVAWSSSQPTIASISNASGSEGVATGLSLGNTKIEAAFDGVAGSALLTVTPATLVSIEVAPINPTAPIGIGTPFTATGVFTNASSRDLTSLAAWSSSNVAVAVVSDAPATRGIARGVSQGNAQIQATLNGITGSTNLTITSAALVAIEVSPIRSTLPLGFTESFTATGLFSNLTTDDLSEQVAWSSSTPTVASISNAEGSKGVATSLSLGSTQIQAALEGITGAATLTATPAHLVSIEIDPVNPSLAIGLTLPFTATGIFSDDSTRNLTESVSWISADPTIASISNSPGTQGVATALTRGNTQIQAALNGITGSTTLAATAAILTSIEVSPSAPSIPAGLSQSFTATGTFSDGSTQDLTDSVLWNSSNAAVASISNAPGTQGVATALSTGSTQIQAALNGIAGSATLTVAAASLTSIQVTPADPSLPAGFSQSFTATGTFSDSSMQDLTDSVFWNSSNSSVASISNASGTQGAATALTTGSTVISASSNGISGNTSLDVTAALLQSLSVAPINPTLDAGTTLQFTATGTFSDSSTQDLTKSATWSSSNPSTASISNALASKGLATGLTQGSTTIAATLNGIAGSTSLSVQGPMITSLSPNFGPKAGGNSIDIVGVALSQATGVNFGSTPASSFSVVNSTLITATAPPGALSTVQVNVTVSSGTTPPSTNPYYAYQGSWTAYVANQNGNSVTPIALDTDTPQTNIPVLGLPSDIAITPDGNMAYVCAYTANQVVPISLATNSARTPIPVKGPLSIAITPDGTLAYVTSAFYPYVTPIRLATQLPETPIILSLPIETAITPDGTTAYVTSVASNYLLPIAVATQTPQPPIVVGSGPSGIAITPDGAHAYIGITGDDTVTDLLLATQQVVTQIPISSGVSSALTISPDGSTAYVPTQNIITPITLATNTKQTPIVFPTYVSEMAITPDGLKGYATVSSNNTVTPLTLSTQTLGTPIDVPGYPYAVSISPDPAPIALFTAATAPAGSPTSFDASDSVSSVGAIVSYEWDFGDSQTQTTAVPTVDHTYASAGSYTVTLTVTNSAGTSTTQIFTGQTVSNNGGPSATTTQTVVIS